MCLQLGFRSGDLLSVVLGLCLLSGLPFTNGGFAPLLLPQDMSGGRFLALAVCPMDTLSWTENLKAESTQQVVFVYVKTFSFSVIVVLELFVRSDFQNHKNSFFKKKRNKL